MPNTTFVYALLDPITGLIRYIGKSDNPQRRFKNHLNDTQRQCHRTNWIQSLIQQQLSPILEVIDEVPHTEWQFWEREYIRVFKLIGMRLVNGTSGGDGTQDISLETRAKMSVKASSRVYSNEYKARMKALWTPELRERIAASRRGKKASPETIARLRASHAGTIRGPLSEQHRHKLREIRLAMGFKHTPETKAKMSAAMLGTKRRLGKPFSKEARAKLRASHLGRILPPEQRAKISASLRAAYALGKRPKNKSGS